jgi:hypothetical protein
VDDDARKGGREGAELQLSPIIAPISKLLYTIYALLTIRKGCQVKSPLRVDLAQLNLATKYTFTLTIQFMCKNRGRQNAEMHTFVVYI